MIDVMFHNTDDEFLDPWAVRAGMVVAATEYDHGCEWLKVKLEARPAADDVPPGEAHIPDRVVELEAVLRAANSEIAGLRAENQRLRVERDRAVETRENANSVSVRVEGENARLRAELRLRIAASRVLAGEDTE